MNKILLFFLLIVLLAFLISLNSRVEKGGLDYTKILDKELSEEEGSTIQGNDSEVNDSEVESGGMSSSASSYGGGGGSSGSQTNDKSGGSTTKQLSEFQQTACEAADEANTCDTNLKRLDIVKKKDCCDVLGLCCN